MKIMQMNELLSIYQGLLAGTNVKFKRSLYDKIDWSTKLVAIVGARGVGKTTMLLQYIKLNKIEKDSLYVSADNIYFTKNNLFELAGNFYKYGGKYLFIDEIHKYTNWTQEIKNIYDSYKGLNVVFTGSSIVDIYSGFGELSRRVVVYKMEGLSFREFLEFSENVHLKPLNFDDIISQKVSLKLDKPLKLFKDYLKFGYYPFFIESNFSAKLNGAVNAVLEVDIPKYLNISTTHIDKLKFLMQIIAESTPFKPNFSKIAEMMNVSRNNIPDYILFLEKAKLINQLRNYTKGIRALGKVEKVYLNNTNLMYNLANENTNTGNIRETFFLNQASVNHSVKLPEKGDFIVDEKYIFEVGGKNKTQKQIENLENAFIVKEDIEVGFGNVIPLWYFGLMY